MCHWSAKSSSTMTQAERDAHRQRVKDATGERWLIEPVRGDAFDHGAGDSGVVGCDGRNK